jgi:O-antigen/teichoic acid export membrane protein
MSVGAGERPLSPLPAKEEGTERSPLPSNEGEAAGFGQRFRSLLGKGTLALLDQGVVSITSLLSMIVVGRASNLDDVGLYSLGLTLTVFIACAQESLIASPYALYGNRLQGQARLEFAGSLLLQAGLVAALAIGGLFLAGAVLATGVGPPGLAPVVWILAAVVPWVLLREFARRFAIAHIQLTTALVIDVTVSVLQLGGLLVLSSYGALTPEMAFLTLAAACAVTGLAWLFLARKQFAVRLGQVRADWSRSWAFGRWVFASQMMGLANSYALHWLLALWLGAEATGGLALCMSVANLANPFVLGVGNLLTPKAVQAYNDGGVPELRRVVAFAGWLMAAAMLAFCLLAFLVGGEAIHWLYRKYEPSFGMIVTLLALAQVARAVSLAPANGLGALERSDVNFRSGLFGLVITLIASACLVGPWGITGAALAMVIGAWSGLVYCWLAFRQLAGEAHRAEGQS